MAAGIYVCTGCGLQLGGQIISEDTEWRTFADDGTGGNKVDPNRVGGPEDELLADFGLSTMIAGDVGLERQQNQEVMTGIYRSLVNGFKRIDYFSGKMCLPKSTVNRAKYLFKRIKLDNFR